MQKEPEEAQGLGRVFLDHGCPSSCLIGHCASSGEFVRNGLVKAIRLPMLSTTRSLWASPRKGDQR